MIVEEQSRVSQRPLIDLVAGRGNISPHSCGSPSRLRTVLLSVAPGRERTLQTWRRLTRGVARAVSRHHPQSDCWSASAARTAPCRAASEWTIRSGEPIARRNPARREIPCMRGGHRTPVHRGKRRKRKHYETTDAPCPPPAGVLRLSEPVVE